MKISSKSKDIVNDLDSSTDDGLLEWIAFISKQSKSEEIRKYRSIEGITDGYMNLVGRKFLEEKKLKQTKKFFEIIDEIEKIEKQKEILEEERNKRYFVTSYEVLYRFQEDLIENDFDLLVEFFFDEEVDEILPEIKEKYKDVIEVKMESRKFNF